MTNGYGQYLAWKLQTIIERGEDADGFHNNFLEVHI